MAMKLCPECGSVFDDSLSSCPDCNQQGEQLDYRVDHSKAPTATKKMGCVTGCLLIFVVVMVGGFIFSSLGAFLEARDNKYRAEQSHQVEVGTKELAVAGGKLRYHIVKEVPNERYSKNTLEVVLDARADKATLEKIAVSLRSTRTQYERLWIFYFLPNMKNHNAGAWAISHFRPNLDLKILGTTAEEDKRLRATPAHQKNIIGKWLDNRPGAGSTMIIFKKSGKLFMKTTFKDGSSMKSKLIVEQVNGKTKYQATDDTFGEYYMLEYNGNLGMYSSNGKFGEAEKIK